MFYQKHYGLLVKWFVEQGIPKVLTESILSYLYCVVLSFDESSMFTVLSKGGQLRISASVQYSAKSLVEIFPLHKWQLLPTPGCRPCRMCEDKVQWRCNVLTAYEYVDSCWMDMLFFCKEHGNEFRQMLEDSGK